MIFKIIGNRSTHVFILLSIILLGLGCKNDDAVEQAPDPRPQEVHTVPLGITKQEFISSRSFKGLQEALRGLSTSASWHRNAAPTAEQLLERLNLDSTYYHTAHDMEVLHAPVRTNGSYKRTFLSLSKQDITQAYILTYPDASDHKLYYVSTLGGLLLQKTTINDQGYGSNEVYNTLPSGHAASRASSAGRCYETVYHYCSSGNHSFADGNAMDCEYWGNLGAGTPPTVTTLEYPCDGGASGGSSGSSGGGWGPSNGGQVGGGGHGNGGFQNVTPPRGGPSILNDCFDVLDCNNCYLYGDLNGDCNIDTYETCLLQGGNYDNGSYCQYDFNAIDQRINGIVYSPVGHTEYVQFMLGMQQSNYTAFLYLLNNDTLIEAVYYYFEEHGHDQASESFVSLAIEAEMFDGEVDWEEQIINGLEGKAKCIYDKLHETSTGFKNAIKLFDGEFPVAHLKFENSSDLPNTVNAQTSPPSNYLITIEINENNLNRPNLSIARTIIHETIHAEMFRKILSILDNGGNLEGLTRTEWLNKLSSGDYPGIYDYYVRFGVNDMQHEQMAAHYRTIIINMLVEFQSGLPQNIYDSLAWVGLKDTETWNALSDSEKNTINSTIGTFNAAGEEECN